MEFPGWTNLVTQFSAHFAPNGISLPKHGQNLGLRLQVQSALNLYQSITDSRKLWRRFCWHSEKTKFQTIQPV